MFTALISANCKPELNGPEHIKSHSYTRTRIHANTTKTQVHSLVYKIKDGEIGGYEIINFFTRAVVTVYQMTNSRRKEGMIGRTWYCPSPPHVIWLCTFAYYTAFWLLSKTYIYIHIYAHGVNLSIMHAELHTYLLYMINYQP